ncbi:polyprenyl glycosylphosphotransferase [Kocuria sp. UCD-OTCP]|nr:polyprenyl glycosylphosphotransferase [Kocuria sp. UCD-OTCP]
MLKQTGISRPASWQDDYVRTVRATDAAMMTLTVAVAQLIRFGFDSGALPVLGLRMPYWGIGVLLGLAWWGWLELRGTRDIRLVGQGVEESKELVNATLVLFGTLAIVSYALDIPTARGYVIVVLPIGTGLLLLGRGRIRRRLARHRQAGVATSRTMVVGCPSGVLETVTSLQKHPGAGFDPVAMYAPTTSLPLHASVSLVQQPPNLLPDGHSPDIASLLDACRDRQIEVLVLCASAPFSPEEIRHLSWYLADERIRLILDTGLTDVAGPRIHTQHVAGLPLIHVSTPKMTRSRWMYKRLVDVLSAMTALAVLAPMMLVLALIVRSHDGGPAFFAQERVGLDGKVFRMWKFRSMYQDAEERRATLLDANESAGGVLFKMKNDPRVTRPGRWMREYSLDELPQFLNVLLGHMSLVGPRPPLATEVAKYEDYVNRRLRVKPGITGLWQISGRSNLSWEEAVRLDLYYVENWSPTQDLVILLRTVKAVLARDGAY